MKRYLQVTSSLQFNIKRVADPYFKSCSLFTNKSGKQSCGDFLESYTFLGYNFSRRLQGTSKQNMDPNSYLGWDPYETNTLPSPYSQKVSRRVPIYAQEYLVLFKFSYSLFGAGPATWVKFWLTALVCNWTKREVEKQWIWWYGLCWLVDSLLKQFTVWLLRYLYIVCILSVMT